jgi:hypothetical protein
VVDEPIRMVVHIISVEEKHSVFALRYKTIPPTLILL